jgi:hypothetical protein
MFLILFHKQNHDFMHQVNIHTHENGKSSGESIVTIKSDGAAKTFRDRIQAAMRSSSNQYQLGSSSYAEQFRSE